MPKYIFVTGGVVSSLGKGIVAASIGLLLKSRGLNVAHQKLDPYLNANPGAMDPEEHGEVYITEDGNDTDLDLGYYERFTGTQMHKNSSYSAGKIYNILFQKEQKGGEFYGKTIQVVPHLTNEIQTAIRSAGNEKTDIVIVEIGGTVGDIEGFPFLEAARLFRQKEGYRNTYFVHCTLIPHLKKADEIKTKPTQHSVAELRKIGITPNMLVCRVEEEHHLNEDVREKLGLFCNVDTNSVLGSFDYKHTIYEIPVSLANQNIDTQILDYFRLPITQTRQIDEWLEYIENFQKAKDEITIAIIGKYTKIPDTYKSITESIHHAATALKVKADIKVINSGMLEAKGKGDFEKAEKILKNVDGILVPDAFGDKVGIEGKITAIKYARENNIPFFGIGLGMQMAAVEFARNICGFADACSCETDNRTKHPIIENKVARLGAKPCKLSDKTLAAKLYGKNEISERHRHSYEFNNEYRKKLEEKGMVFSGLSADGLLVDIVELPKHPHFVGVQFRPEFKSRPIEPHPLFTGFIEAAIEKCKIGKYRRTEKIFCAI